MSNLASFNLSVEFRAETGALAVQPRGADVDQEGDGVSDDSDDDDDRQNVDVEDRDDAVELRVGLVDEQFRQLLHFTLAQVGYAARGRVELDAEVLPGHISVVRSHRIAGDVHLRQLHCHSTFWPLTEFI